MLGLKLNNVQKGPQIIKNNGIEKVIQYTATSIILWGIL